MKDDLLFVSKNGIRMGDGRLLKIALDASGSLPKSRISTTLVRLLSKRYMPDQNLLNLTQFTPKIPGFTTSYSSGEFVSYLLRAIAERYNTTTTLLLDENQIRSLAPFQQLSKVLPRLERLSLNKNQIRLLVLIFIYVFFPYLTPKLHRQSFRV